jgi:NAD+ synthase
METTGIQSALSLNSDQVRKVLVGFLRDEIRNTGHQKAVIGLSGGVDSALSAYLAVEALGPVNVLGVLMPYKTSSPRSKTDAEQVVHALGIRSRLVEISPMVDAFAATIGDVDRMRLGNVMARQRMIVLYDLSVQERALVVGTGNKTETLLGYTTLFGDNACAINPLGDLYKTQVWDLAKVMGVPREIVKKQPSADLWAGQTDEGELGFSYKEVDRLLYYMVDERRTVAELESLGFEKALVEKISAIIRTTQYKRRLPLIAKVSHRTVNLDFRYVRDWGI